MNLNEIRDLAHKNSVEHGFWEGQDERFIPEKIALIHSEASEALEDFREGKMLPERLIGGKPVGFGSELADIIIRVGDLAGFLKIDIEKEVRDKMDYNATRPYRHGGKKA